MNYDFSIGFWKCCDSVEFFSFILLQNSTQKTKYRETPSQNPGVNSGVGRVNSSCCTCGTRRGTFSINSVICHDLGKDQIVITTNGLITGLKIITIFDWLKPRL